MPKRHKHLFEQVVSLENLFTAAHKAMRGKRGKVPVARCFGELKKAVVGVRDDLIAGTWQLGEHFYFTSVASMRRKRDSANVSTRSLAGLAPGGTSCRGRPADGGGAARSLRSGR